MLIGCLLWYTLAVYQTFYERDSAPSIGPYCSHLAPISAEEFTARQNALARTLVDLHASAYIAEPGASTQYFANYSNWGLSERPLLLIITPDQSGEEVKAKVSVLTPAFEAVRAKQSLPVASDGQ